MAVMPKPRRELRKQTFEMLSDLELPRVLSHATLRDCTFMACDFGSTASTVAARRTIREVTLINCKATNNTSLGPAIIEDVDVEALKTSGLCIAWGAVYKHVRLRGSCGNLLLTQPSPGERERVFLPANAEFYRHVDWALDIAEGEFEELDIRGVPARLIRRDPQTQVVVRRERVLSTQAVWSKLDLAGTPWPMSLTNMLAWGLEDKVLVAPKRKKTFPVWLAGLRLLQDAGVAEPG
jgi:hypothetical protein